jgi:hypothetical protein
MVSLTAVSSFDLLAALNLLASFSPLSELRRLYVYDSSPFLAVMRAAAASSSAVKENSQNMEIHGRKRDEHTLVFLGLLNHAVDLLRRTTLVVGV